METENLSEIVLHKYTHTQDLGALEGNDSLTQEWQPSNQNI